MYFWLMRRVAWELVSLIWANTHTSFPYRYRGTSSLQLTTRMEVEVTHTLLGTLGPTPCVALLTLSSHART